MMVLPGTLDSWRSCAVALVGTACAAAAPAQSEGGLYPAGAGFSFKVAAERAMAQNPGVRRVFLLSLPPETAALPARATPALTTLRNRVVSANGVLLVCQRDIDNRRIDAAGLTPGVVAVRGWPRTGSHELPDGRARTAAPRGRRIRNSNTIFLAHYRPGTAPDPAGW